jgi:hypothetical protein
MRIVGVISRGVLTRLIIAFFKLEATDRSKINEGYEQISTLGMIVLNNDHALSVSKISSPGEPKAMYRINGELDECEADLFWMHLEAEDWKSEEGDELGPQLLRKVSQHPPSIAPLPSPKR